MGLTCALPLCALPQISPPPSTSPAPGAPAGLCSPTCCPPAFQEQCLGQVQGLEQMSPLPVGRHSLLPAHQRSLVRPWWRLC